jgi:hypothetical protein
MIGSIERGWRSLTRQSLAPVMMLVVGIHGPVDPTRRTTGYGGVIPVPAPATPAVATTTRLEPMLDQQRRELRAARGRVLYADGRASQITAPRTERKAQCPERRVVEGRANPAPNS